MNKRVIVDDETVVTQSCSPLLAVGSPMKLFEFSSVWYRCRDQTFTNVVITKHGPTAMWHNA